VRREKEDQKNEDPWDLRNINIVTSILYLRIKNPENSRVKKVRLRKHLIDLRKERDGKL
jgi:hypothetical protein